MGKNLFLMGFLIMTVVVCTITPCSILFTLPIVCGAFLFGVGRRSAIDGEDSSELPNQLTLFCMAALFGSLLNIFLLILWGMHK